jgi:ribonuclease BN (tRNA processing enzyme)
MRTPQLILLGTGTCRLEPDRAASAVLVDTGTMRLVFDFGRGVATRLVTLGLTQDDLGHVVLSHYHPDHLSDLIPYLQAGNYSPDDPRGRDLHVYGPPGLGAVMRSIVHLVGEGDLFGQERFRVHTHELGPGRHPIGGHPFRFTDLPPAGNQGLRFDLAGTRCALTGDSHFHDGEVAFLRDADLAVIDSGHLTDDEIVRLLVDSRVQRVVCSHFYRELDIAALEAGARSLGWTGSLEAGRDLQRLVG